MTATNKNSMIGKTIYAGDAKIYPNPYPCMGSKQYYEDDPYYVVLYEDNHHYAVRHHSLKDGVTGWFWKSEVFIVEDEKPNQIDAFKDAVNEFKQVKKDIMAIAEKLGDIVKRLG